MRNHDRPSTVDELVARRDGQGLAKVLDLAVLHRHVNLVIVTWVVYAGVGAVLSGAVRGSSDWIATGYFFVALASAIVAFRLFYALDGERFVRPVWAIRGIALMFVPVFNFVALIVLSSQGATRLREAGIKVGLLGADMTRVRRDVEKGQARDSGPQLAGKPCIHCQQKIVSEATAAQCKVCNAPVHRACRKAHRESAHAS